MRPAAVPCLLLALAGGASGAIQDDRDMKNRPISKVVTLLKEMVSQLQKEADEDGEVFEAMGCWCETNDREKTKVIADAETKIIKLNSEIEHQMGASGQLATEIEQLLKEVAENTEALDTATALRKKQLAEFTEEEKDMLQSIGSLGSAVTVLGKHHGASLVQVSNADQIDLVVTIQDQLRRHKTLLAEAVTPTQRRMLEAFAKEGLSSGFLQHRRPSFEGIQESSGYNPEYKPQGGAIFGVLETMKESFETNLAKSQEEESTNQQAYVDLKAAKESELKAGNEQIMDKTLLRAQADEKHAQATEDLHSTEDTMEADIKYLASVKEHCANIDAEYEERVKTRQLEIAAVSKALQFLVSDEASDLFAKSLGFFQRASHTSLRADVASRMQAAAKAAHDPRVSALAVRVRADVFAKVRETLQNMIDKLIQEKEDEIKQKDYCIDSLNENMRITEDTVREKDDANAKMEDHINAMETLTKAIEADHAQIALLRMELKRATEAREQANRDFQETIADQRATQKLLTATLGVLKGFYEKAALLQTKAQAPAGPPPHPGFKKYNNNAASGGVMNMIQTIIDDAKAMEAEALVGEEQEQQAYEDFTNDTNEAVITLQKDIAIKTETKAREEQGKVMEETTRDEKIGVIEQLKKENLDLHFSCDYMIKNFDVRMTARDDEVEALKEGLATFSGATFTALLQQEV